MSTSRSFSPSLGSSLSRNSPHAGVHAPPPVLGVARDDDGPLREAQSADDPEEHEAHLGAGRVIAGAHGQAEVQQQEV